MQLTNKTLTQITTDNEDKIGDIVLDHTKFLLIGENKRTKITQEPYKLLCLLKTNINSFVSIEVIEKKLWPDNYISAEAIRTLVSRLSKKIREVSECVLIRNEYGYGYMLTVLNSTENLYN